MSSNVLRSVRLRRARVNSARGSRAKGSRLGDFLSFRSMSFEKKRKATLFINDLCCEPLKKKQKKNPRVQYFPSRREIQAGNNWIYASNNTLGSFFQKRVKNGPIHIERRVRRDRHRLLGRVGTARRGTLLGTQRRRVANYPSISDPFWEIEEFACTPGTLFL